MQFPCCRRVQTTEQVAHFLFSRKVAKQSDGEREREKKIDGRKSEWEAGLAVVSMITRYKLIIRSITGDLARDVYQPFGGSFNGSRVEFAPLSLSLPSAKRQSTRSDN